MKPPQRWQWQVTSGLGLERDLASDEWLGFGEGFGKGEIGEGFGLGLERPLW